MGYLLLVSLIWAVSFGLMATLSDIDSTLVATIRLGIAGLLFAPLLKPQYLTTRERLQLIACGAIQFGIMYVSYIQAFQYLPSHLVALFSVFTPLYVIVINDLNERKCSLVHLIAAGLSIAGAAVIKAKSGEPGVFWLGFLLMQVAGISFAFGQVYYRNWKRKNAEISDYKVFGLLYIGGLSFALLISLLTTNWSEVVISSKQWLVLTYLGVVASGLGFYLWNKGAALSQAGTLAAFNNAVVPLAMAFSLFIFGEIKDITSDQMIRLLVGGALIFGAIVFAEKAPKTAKQ